jgi:hypothetical protein
VLVNPIGWRFEGFASVANRYAPEGAAALVVVYATGQHAGEALVVLRLKDFRRVAGLEEVPPQGILPGVGR